MNDNKFERESILLGFFICVYFFYLGTSVPEDNSKLLAFIANALTALASICTIAALYFAYKTYMAKEHQITHPKQYDIDMALLREFNEIHKSCVTVLHVHAYNLAQLIHDLKNNKEECDRTEEWEEFVRAAKGVLNINLKMQFSREITFKSYSELDDYEDIPEVLKDYFVSLNKLIDFTLLICNLGYESPLISADGPIEFRGESYCVSDLAIGGALHRDLETHYKNVKAFYKKRWPRQIFND